MFLSLIQLRIDKAIGNTIHIKIIDDLTYSYFLIFQRLVIKVYIYQSEYRKNNRDKNNKRFN